MQLPVKRVILKDIERTNMQVLSLHVTSVNLEQMVSSFLYSTRKLSMMVYGIHATNVNINTKRKYYFKNRNKIIMQKNKLLLQWMQLINKVFLIDTKSTNMKVLSRDVTSVIFLSTLESNLAFLKGLCMVVYSIYVIFVIIYLQGKQVLIRTQILSILV